MSAEFTSAVQIAIRDRSEGLCELCGAARAWDAHHRHPRKMGGTKRDWVGYPSNALHCCRACHTVIETNRMLAVRLGWLVPEGDNPETVPVLWRGSFVLLTADGGIERAA